MAAEAIARDTGPRTVLHPPSRSRRPKAGSARSAATSTSAHPMAAATVRASYPDTATQRPERGVSATQLSVALPKVARATRNRPQPQSTSTDPLRRCSAPSPFDPMSPAARARSATPDLIRPQRSRHGTSAAAA